MSTDPLTIIHGDALSSLRELEDESVQTCVTSPPYWGLRDYGHEWQIGLEKTPDEYVARLVEIFREVKRVMRKDGTLWLNLGDSYAGSWGNYGGQNRGNGSQREITLGSKAPQKSYEGLEAWKPPTANSLSGVKPKDLVGIPWMVAFALRADGWYLRSDIIWSKPNPMPESVTDRPTKSHEYIFLFSKSERYYYNADAIREPYQDVHHPVGADGRFINPKAAGGVSSPDWEPPISSRFKTTNIKREYNPQGRNKRSVWTVTTQPFSGAHFATFPPELIKPCILAGAPVGGTVIDPFAGSFTTCKVAIELGRRAIGIEPKSEYVELGRRRCQTTIGLPLVYEQPDEAAQVPPDVLGDAQLALGTEDCVESR